MTEQKNKEDPQEDDTMTATTMPKISFQEPRRGAITQLTARVKTSSGKFVEVKSPVGGCVEGIGGLLRSRKSASTVGAKPATYTTSEPSSANKKPFDSGPRVLRTPPAGSQQSHTVSFLRRGDGDTAKNKSATGTTSLSRGGIFSSPTSSRKGNFAAGESVGDFLRTSKPVAGLTSVANGSVGKVAATVKSPPALHGPSGPSQGVMTEKSPPTEQFVDKTNQVMTSGNNDGTTPFRLASPQTPAANISLPKEPALSHGNSKSSQVTQVEPSTVAPSKAPRNERYVSTSPSLWLESVANTNETLGTPGTPVSSNRTKELAWNTDQRFDKDKIDALKGEQSIFLEENHGEFKASAAQYGDFQTPRPFSNKTQSTGTKMDTDQLNEGFAAEGIGIDTPSFSGTFDDTRPSFSSWDYENRTSEAKTATFTTEQSYETSSTPECAKLLETKSTMGMTTNLVTPGPNLKHMKTSDDAAFDNSSHSNENVEHSSVENMDWESMHAEFSQNMQDCGDIFQEFDSDMLEAMEILEAAHADLQKMEGKVLDHVLELEDLEARMDSMIESYNS